jgi:hypothetical protein
MFKNAAFIAVLAISQTVVAQTASAEYDAVLKMLGKQGDYKANVLKIQHTEE